MQAQASGLWILAAVAAIAAIAVLGQVMTRQVRPTQEERERLSAIGFTKSQILAEASARGGHPHHDRLAAGRGGGGPWLRSVSVRVRPRPRAASGHSCGLARRARWRRALHRGSDAVDRRRPGVERSTKSRSASLVRWSRRWPPGAAVRRQASACDWRSAGEPANGVRFVDRSPVFC